MAAVHEVIEGVKELKVSIGDIVVFERKENPSTGYSWHFDHDDGLKEVENAHHRPQSDRERPMCGAPGVRRARWEVTGPAKLRFLYERAWEKKESNEGVEEVTITIVDVVNPPLATQTHKHTMAAVHEVIEGVKELKVSIGDIVVFERKENPSTGYSWHFDYDDGLKEVENAHHRPQSDRERPMCGAPGVRRARWEVTGPAKLRFLYERAWEKKESNEGVEEVTITIAAKKEEEGK